MQDRLEQILKDQRPDFDDRTPPGDLWGKIEHAIHQEPAPTTDQSPKGYLRILRVAAAVMLLLGLGAWGGMYYANLQSGPESILANNPAYQEFVEAEAYLVKQINIQKGELETINGVDLLESDLKELEDHFNELKNELGASGDREVIINAMIENYRMRIRLMEHVLLKHAEAAKNL
ncbi:MAG: hypothetical protein AAFV80_03585 [Bacteroidota bacterium]